MLLMPQEYYLRAVATPSDVLEVLGSFGVAIPPEVLQATQVGRTTMGLAAQPTPVAAVASHA
jgi:hypothetical protein